MVRRPACRSGMKPNVMWTSTEASPITGILNPLAGGIDQAIAFGTSQASLGIQEDLTFLRTHLSFYARELTQSQVGPIQIGVGLGIVPERVSQADSAAPQSLVDMDWDGWFLHWTGWVEGFSTVGGAGVSDILFVRAHIDSKAKRKMDSDSILFVLIQAVNLDLSTAASIEFGLGLRSFIKTN